METILLTAFEPEVREAILAVLEREQLANILGISPLNYTPAYMRKRIAFDTRLSSQVQLNISHATL